MRAPAERVAFAPAGPRSSRRYGADSRTPAPHAGRRSLRLRRQIKVRDFSRSTVSLQPAEYASWSEARADLVVEAKRPLKAQLQAELSTADTAEAQDEIRAAFAAREKAVEHDIDHKVLDCHLELGISYNFLSK